MSPKNQAGGKGKGTIWESQQPVEKERSTMGAGPPEIPVSLPNLAKGRVRGETRGLQTW